MQMPSFLDASPPLLKSPSYLLRGLTASSFRGSASSKYTAALHKEVSCNLVQ